MGEPGNRAIITGIGLRTPVGRHVTEVFGSVLSGRSGLRRPSEEQRAVLPVDSAGFAPPVDPLDVLPGTEARSVDRFVLLALGAADDALADAGLVVGEDVDPAR